MQEEHYKNLSLENLPNEEWRDIEGYEGLYQVSNMGRVKSDVTNRIRKLGNNGYGYFGLILSKDGINTRHHVHRLVALHFIENPNNYPCVNHKNEFEKWNNCASHLEWCTYKYNNNYGTGKKRAGVAISKTHREAGRVPILEYDLNGIFIKEWRTTIEAAEYYKITPVKIYSALNNKTYKAADRIWKYKLNSNYPKTINKLKPKFQVLQYSLNGQFIKEWDSAIEASNFYSVSNVAINNNIIGKSKSCCGFIWKRGDSLDIKTQIESYKRTKISKSVLQYNLDGTFVKEWDDVKTASIYYNCTSSAIFRNINGESSSCCNFMWKYKLSDDFPKNILPFIPFKPIFQYDLNYNVINEWNSAKEASNCLKISLSGICSVANGKQNSAGGFIWTYKSK